MTANPTPPVRPPQPAYPPAAPIGPAYPPPPPASSGFPGWAIALIIGGVVAMAGLVVIFMLLSMLLPALGAARRTARRMENDTRVRGIHQSCVTYASGNQSFFPGRLPDGKDGDLSIEARYKLLFDNAYFTGDFAVSPLDTQAKPWQSGPVTSGNYSFAMLQVPPVGERRTEWADTINTDAAVVGDRNLDPTANGGAGQSVHDQKRWRGAVAFNDNHVEYKIDRFLATSKYGPLSMVRDDIWDNAPCPVVANSDPRVKGGTTGDNALLKFKGNANDRSQ